MLSPMNYILCDESTLHRFKDPALREFARQQLVKHRVLFAQRKDSTTEKAPTARTQVRENLTNQKRTESDARQQQDIATVQECDDLDCHDTTPLPKPLPELYPVPKMMPDMLPDLLLRWCELKAVDMQVPIEFLAVPMICCLSTIIAGAFVVQLTDKTSYIISPNLSGILIAPPGRKKSPCVAPAVAILEKLDAAADNAAGVARAEAKMKAEIYKKRAKKLDTQVSKMIDEGKSDDEIIKFKRENAIEPPPEVFAMQYLAGDASPEAFGALQQHAPSIFLNIEELSYLLEVCDKKDYNAGARQLYLTAIDGLRGHRWHRVGRDDVILHRMCANLCSTIQPDILRQYTLPAIKGEKGADGFWNRLSLAIIPDLPAPRKNKDRQHVSNSDERAAYERIVLATQRLANFNAPTPIPDDPDGRERLLLDKDAQALWYELDDERNFAVCNEQLLPFQQNQIAKESKTIGALAGVFALLEETDFAESERQYTVPTIKKKHIEMSMRWRDYLREHMKRIIQSAYGSGEHDSAVSLLATKIIEGKLQDGFTVRDVVRKNWHGLYDRKTVEFAVGALVECLWLFEYEEGRTVRYSINTHIKRGYKPLIIKVQDQNFFEEDEAQAELEAKQLESTFVNDDEENDDDIPV